VSKLHLRQTTICPRSTIINGPANEPRLWFPEAAHGWLNQDTSDSGRRLAYRIPPHLVLTGRLPAGPSARHAVASWPSVVIHAGDRIHQPFCSAIRIRSTPNHGTCLRSASTRSCSLLCQRAGSQSPKLAPIKGGGNSCGFIACCTLVLGLLSMPCLKVPGIVLTICCQLIPQVIPRSRRFSAAGLHLVFSPCLYCNEMGKIAACATYRHIW
jgi:hypothetical protein